jgi:hypothetical protein
MTHRLRGRYRSALRPRLGLGLVSMLTLAAACSEPPAPSESLDGGSAFDAANVAPETAMEGAASLRGRGGRPDRDALPTAPQASDPMLIRTGAARLEVDSLEAAVVRVEALAARLGGMVVSSAFQTGARQHREASLSIKVPAARFDEALGGLTPVGRLESLHVNTEDVGEEFVDISARLASARQLEQRLLEILRTRTGKLEDVLAVERELARVRSEIERYEGRLRHLRSRVDMSVLAISLHEPIPTLATPPGVNVIGEAFKQAWRNFVALLATGIAALGFLVPIGLLVGGVLVVVRWNRRPSPAAPVSGPATVS